MTYLLTILLFGISFNIGTGINPAEMSSEAGPEHAVIIHFKYGLDGTAKLYQLEDDLEELLSKNPKVGELDGDEMAADYSDGYLYLYGPNAEELFNLIKPLLVSTDFMKGAKVTLRFGPPEDGVREVEIEL